MTKLILRMFLIWMAAFFSLSYHVALANQTIIIDDFDDELPAGFYDYQGDGSTVSAGIQIFGPTATLARPNQSDNNGVLEVSYDISDFGGVARVFEEGPQDWSSSVSLHFWIYGTNSGHLIQFEIFDNRSPDADDPAAVDTSERYEYRFEDDFDGWKELAIPFANFRRATDFQPANAPDDGLTLTEVWGYSFVLPAAAGSLYVDDLALNDSVTIADYEAGKPSIFFDFKGEASTLTTSIKAVDADEPEARIGQLETNQVLAVDFDITDFGGVTHSFEAAPQDWSSFVAFSFWFFGNGTGERFQIEIFDNRSDPDAVTEEHFEYVFTDDVTGWQQLVIPFGRFVRSTDFQPEGAPDDGFNLTEIWGYSFTLPQSAGTILIDQIAISRSIEVPLAQDQKVFSGSFSGSAFSFTDDLSLMETEIITVDVDSEIALPMQAEMKQVLQVTYTITESGESYGGFTNLFATPKDWQGLTAFEFWFYGSATGAFFQIEILNNRSANGDADIDSSERFQYYFNDYLRGWRKITIPFSQFTRAADFQPEGAPNDGLKLDEMWGFSLTFPRKEGVLYLGDVSVVREVNLINFEESLPTGWFPFPRTTEAVTNTIISLNKSDPLARPGQTATNHVLEVTYDIETFGGLAYVFDPTPRNWFGYTGIQFWFYGNDSGERFQFEIRENRSDRTKDTSEYFEFAFVDNFTGWRQFQVPFTDFQRATDFQPEGAPDDGFTLTEVWGYSFTFPVASGKVYVDDMMLYGLTALPGSSQVYLPLLFD